MTDLISTPLSSPALSPSALSASALSPSERARVHATAWAILGDASAADDVSQELSLRLQDAPEAGDPRERRSWIARQAIGLSLNRRRGEARRALHEREAGTLAARRRVEQPTDQLEREEDLDHVRGALAGLEERQRLPLILRYFHERRLNEIATILDIPLSTAHERLQRGLSLMRGRLRRSSVAPALIGLSLPRATVVLLPVALAGRASFLVGSAYGLARAAALIAVLGLAPQTPRIPGVEGGATQLQVALVQPMERPPHFVRPPGQPLPLVGPERGATPPEPPWFEGADGAQPGGDSNREDARERQGLEPRADSSPGTRVPLTSAPAAEGSSRPQVLLGPPPAGPSTDEGQRSDVGYDESYATKDQGGRDDDGDGPPPTGEGNSPGAGDSGQDNGGDKGGHFNGPDAGFALGAGFPGGVLVGMVTGADGDEPLPGLWVQLVPVGQDLDPFDAPPPSAVATDELGQFRIELPVGPGAWIWKVGVPNSDGQLDELRLRAGGLGADGAWRLDLDLDGDLD